MTPISNSAQSFRTDMLAGFCDLYANYVMPVPGGVVRTHESKPGKVAGSCGAVGPGITQLFVAWSVQVLRMAQWWAMYLLHLRGKMHIKSVKQLSVVGGFYLITGNYAGDVLNFG